MANERVKLDDCNCEERFAVVNGKSVRLPKPEYYDHHSCSYVRERNALIPRASLIAYDITPRDPYTDKSEGNRWTKNFAQAMEELWATRKEIKV